MAATNYIVNIKYKVHDGASKQIDRLTNSLRMAGNASKALGTDMGRMRVHVSGAGQQMGKFQDKADRAILSAWNFRKAVFAFDVARSIFGSMGGALVGYNSELEQARIGMTSLLQMQQKLALPVARKEAANLIKQLRIDARQSPGTEKDFRLMAGIIAPEVFAKKGTSKDVRTLTKGTALAASASSMPFDQAARDTMQMIQGKVTIRDRLADQLLKSQGLSREEFNAKSDKERLKLTGELLTQPAILAAAKAQMNSFEGQMATLKSNIQYTLGAVGLPLTKAITKEFIKWNNWIDKNPKKIAAFAKEFGSTLRDGFKMVMDTGRWIIAHKETLMTLGKVLLAAKGLSMISSPFAGVFKTVKEAGTVAGGLSAMAGNLTSLVIPALGAFYVALDKFAGWVGETQEKNMSIDDKREALKYQLGATEGFLGVRQTLDTARKHKILDKNNRINGDILEMRTGLVGHSNKNTEKGLELWNMRENIIFALASEATVLKGLADRKLMDDAYELIFGKPGFGKMKNMDGAGKGDMNINISRIEVASQDPDRFVHQLVKSFDKVRSKGTQSSANAVAGNLK